jgi:hypothetical protein
MSLLIRLNKKDVSIHQAFWHLQDFDFMAFSDKFQRINLHEILKQINTNDYNIEDEDEEDVLEGIMMDRIDTMMDDDKKINANIDIDMNTLKKEN